MFNIKIYFLKMKLKKFITMNTILIQVNNNIYYRVFQMF